jgi:hypothetical protein
VDQLPFDGAKGDEVVLTLFDLFLEELFAFRIVPFSDLGSIEEHLAERCVSPLCEIALVMHGLWHRERKSAKREKEEKREEKERRWGSLFLPQLISSIQVPGIHR